jgi:Ca-activated chloride channel homolog
LKQRLNCAFSALKLAIVFISFCAGAFALADDPRAVFENNRGIQDLDQKNVIGAQRRFLNSQRRDPKTWQARMNLALSFVAQGDIDKALNEFNAVAQDPKSTAQEKFLAHFNRGRLFQELKRKPEALDSYQMALRYDPVSLTAKTNIELLTQQSQGGGQGQNQQQDQQQNQKPDQQGGEQKKQDPGGPQPQTPAQQKLSEKDIAKILEELKDQEQKVRALEFGSKGKDQDNAKNW